MKKKKKNPLTKEQLKCLDEHVKEEFLRRFWSNGPDYLFTGKNWNLTKIRDFYNWCEHDFQITYPFKRLEQCVKCKKIRSFPYYPYTYGEEIKEVKNGD